MDKENQQVTITDVKMPFLSMVVFMVKWAIASIPALIILSLIFVGIATVTASLLNPLGGIFSRSSSISEQDGDMSAHPHEAEKACENFVESHLSSPVASFIFNDRWDGKSMEGQAKMKNDPKKPIRQFTCYPENTGSGWKVTSASIDVE